MEKIKKLPAISITFLLALVLFAGCSSSGSYEKNVKNIINKLLPCSTAQAAELSGNLETGGSADKPGISSDGGRLEKYIKEKYSGIMTENCIKQAAKNREIFAAKALAEEYGKDITVGEIELYGDISNELLFYYNAGLLADGEKIATAEGSVCLSGGDNEKAESLSVNIRRK